MTEQQDISSEDSPFQDRWLRPTAYLDYDDPIVRDYAREKTAGAQSAKDKALALYYAVRDDFRYDPYRVEYAPSGFQASNVIRRGHGYCLPKAALLAAAARSVGIPARLGYGDVRNHLTSEKLRESMGSDLFMFHGYTQLWIDDRWVKATPAFNKAMCDRFGVKPLEFDGVHDSLFHEYDAAGRRHMEYVLDRGLFDDVPVDTILATWEANFPGMVEQGRADSDAAPEEFRPD
ncbi:MAG: transglutaminase family protein [Sphingobium sp.]